jgi:hypothetical protein
MTLIEMNENTLTAEKRGSWVVGRGLWILDLKYKTSRQSLWGRLPIRGWITGGKDAQQLTCRGELC